jgi:WD40 repeat protein
VGVPVIEYRNGRNELLVISPDTGEALDAFAPIPLPLGQDFNYTFAPDGRTLVFVSDGQLYLVDLPAWKYRTSDVGLRGWVSSIVYSPDGSLLALASGDLGGALKVVDVETGEVKASAQVDFSIWKVKFTTDGKAIMVYGPQVTSTWISVGAPKAALLAVPDLSALWSVELDGVRAGIFPKKADTQDIYQPGVAWRFEPGVAFAPNSDMLYAVHGDEDKLTTVDFTDRRVNTVDVRVKTGWFDRLLALTAGAAYAKGMDGTTKQAVISADGKFLYVVGNTSVVSQANGNWDIANTPIGLQVIATEDGALVGNYDTDAMSAYLSVDGRYVFLSGWKDDTYGTPWTEVYDISSDRFVERLDGLNLTPTRRMDGKAILASGRIIGENLYSMALVDPETWMIASEWTGSDYVSWLIDP